MSTPKLIGNKMTPQEIIWKSKTILIVGIVSKSGKIHYNLRKYVGRFGSVEREAKNGMLLVRFRSGHTRSIPAGCLIEADKKTMESLSTHINAQKIGV